MESISLLYKAENICDCRLTGKRLEDSWKPVAQCLARGADWALSTLPSDPNLYLNSAACRVRSAHLVIRFAGLHEAIGEAISLSVATPRHLQALGLVQTAVDDLPHNINFLFALALDKLPFLPFSLSLDKWRWDVFQKRKTKDQYNCHYWFLRLAPS